MTLGATLPLPASLVCEWHGPERLRTKQKVVGKNPELQLEVLAISWDGETNLEFEMSRQERPEGQGIWGKRSSLD